MNNQQITSNNKKSIILTLIGITVMILLTLTKVIPSSTISGYSVLVGIAFFFITEAVSKTRGSESGLRFNTIAADFKKPGVLLLVLLPSMSGIATLVIGNMTFGGEFIAHVMGRTSSILYFDKTALLIGQVIIAAFGEEIAYRGFFFGEVHGWSGDFLIVTFHTVNMEACGFCCHACSFFQIIPNTDTSG